VYVIEGGVYVIEGRWGGVYIICRGLGMLLKGLCM